MAEAQDKGDALEKAVKAIEDAILRTFPNYNDKTFKVEWKKRVNVDGVTHEIDVWVNIELGPGYTSRVIFECKNRQEKANKNDVIILAEKIDVTQAQQGILVARHFSQDAEAQARKNPRITLLVATDLLQDKQKGFLGSFSAFDYESQRYSPLVDVRGQEAIRSLQGLRLDDPTVVAYLNGEEVLFADYFNKWRDELKEDFHRRFSRENRGAGLYTLSHSQKRVFNRKLRLNNIPIHSIVLRGQFRIRVVLPGVTSYFDISTRGRVIAFEPVGVIGGIEIGESYIAMLSSQASSVSGNQHSS